MKVLVVDDNAEVRRLIKNLFTEIDAEVYECGDGAEAIELYIAIRPDWVLMDVFMKKMDGITATEAIRNFDDRAKVIFVTNHTDRRTRQAAVDVGAFAFFGKDDLLSLVSLLNK